MTIKEPKTGSYRYKFVVNDERRIDDPANELKEADGFGEFNSFLNIA